MRRLYPRPVQSADVDLTGGFRLDLKTMVLLGGLLFSWWNVRAEVSQLRGEVTAREQARVKIEAAEAAAQQLQRDALAKALDELQRQLKVTSMDISDLRVAVAQNGRAPINRPNNGE